MSAARTPPPPCRDDRRRIGELLDLIDDEGVDAILCARGGYGCQRIVADLDAAIDHIARHAVTPEEFEEACFG